MCGAYPDHASVRFSKGGPLDLLQLAAKHSPDPSTDLAHGWGYSRATNDLNHQSQGNLEGGLRALWCPSPTSPGNTGETWG